jgi:hypothetical protein
VLCLPTPTVALPVINGYRRGYNSINWVITDLLLVKAITAVEMMITKQHIFGVSPLVCI